MSNKIIKKIKALLAKADSERNDNENERVIAMRQATKMMDEHSVSMTDLDREEDERGRGHAETGASVWKACVINYLGELYGCKVYRTKGRMGKTYVIGRESHRTTVLSMGEYAIKSIEREAKKLRGSGRGYIASFKTGAAAGIFHQVQGIIRERKRGDTTSSSTALAVVNHYALEKKQNEEWLRDFGIRLNSGSKARSSNYAGYQAGRSYGESISLNNQVGGTSSQRRLT